MKNLIKNLNHDIPKLKANLIGAIKRSNIQGWEKIIDNEKEQNKE